MKFTLSWLKEHLETKTSPEEIGEALTMLGIEVESMEDLSVLYKDFIVAQIVDTKPHPDADRLKVCTVDAGKKEPLQIVCGGPNARTGLKVVLAPIGSIIPSNGMKMKPTKIRGIESHGMMCSVVELCLGEESEGIMELSEDAKVGNGFAKEMGLDDILFDVTMTPNRADCFGVRGIARDLAAKGLGTLKSLDVKSIKGNFKNPIHVKIDDKASKACPMFVGRLIRGVKNVPSPEWLRRKIGVTGHQSISALVDITNFITTDRNRPLHVFDANKLKGNISLRFAKKDEKLEALDEETYELDPAMVVISDDSGAISLGGIMGGLSTGCDLDTTDVVLECALFDPITIAHAGRKLNLLSDARTRFERGIDPHSILPGIEAATQMIIDLCGGEASDLVVAGKNPFVEKESTLNFERLNTLGGSPVTSKEAIQILEKLGFETISKNDKSITVKIPSWRPDVEGEHDLIEEVLRVHGYDQIPVLALPRTSDISKPALTPFQELHEKLKRVLAQRGFMEAITYSFISEKEARLFQGAHKSLKLLSPISFEMTSMRPSILPSLLKVLKPNKDRGQANGALFEVGPQYAGVSPEQQSLMATGIRMGSTHTAHWASKERGADAYDVKADAFSVLASYGISANSVQVSQEGAPSWYHPGRSGVLKQGPKNILGYFGEIHPRILKEMDVEGPMVAFEINLSALPLPKRKSKKPLTLNQFQTVERDFAFVVSNDTPADKVLQTARKIDNALIKEATLFDVYSGKGIDKGMKSLAIRIRLEPSKSTLTDDEISQISQKVIGAIEKTTGGKLRA